MLKEQSLILLCFCVQQWIFQCPSSLPRMERKENYGKSRECTENTEWQRVEKCLISFDVEQMYPAFLRHSAEASQKTARREKNLLYPISFHTEPSQELRCAAKPFQTAPSKTFPIWEKEKKSSQSYNYTLGYTVLLFYITLELTHFLKHPMLPSVWGFLLCHLEILNMLYESVQLTWQANQKIIYFWYTAMAADARQRHQQCQLTALVQIFISNNRDDPSKPLSQGSVQKGTGWYRLLGASTGYPHWKACDVSIAIKFVQKCRVSFWIFQRLNYVLYGHFLPFVCWNLEIFIVF